GTGLSPKAPGTVGSLLGAAIAYFLYTTSTELYLQIFLAIGVVILALLSIHFYEKRTGRHDDQQIVVDEIAGIFLAFLGLPLSLPILAAGFLLFRLFDILKPGPIGWADRQLPGAFGTLLDDLLAGVFSCVLLHLIV